MRKIDFGVALFAGLPMSDIVSLSKSCEKFGFDYLWVSDEIYYREVFAVLQIVAANTKKIRIGPGVVAAGLRSPILVAQSIATLDELSNGRTVCGIGSGSFAQLEQCNVSLVKPVSYLREAIECIRSLLKDGKLKYEGQFFKYHGIFTSARPLQSNVPIFIGATGGPKSFELAGEVGDGALIGFALSEEWATHVVETIRVGAQKSGKTLDPSFNLMDVVILGIHNDAAVARETIKPLVTFYTPAFTQNLLKTLNVDLDLVNMMATAVKEGDFLKALGLASDDIIDKLSICGTPDDVIDKLENLHAAGFNGFSFHIPDLKLYKETLGSLVNKTNILLPSNAPTILETLQMFRQEVMPYFKR